METNALMGKNVARLIIDRILDEDTEEALLFENLGENSDQSVMQEL